MSTTSRRICNFVRIAACLLLACLASQLLSAQPIRKLKPGTLVRITTLTGERIEGPLAELRADTVFLGTTLSQPERAVSLVNARQFAYADGEVGHSLRGALIGAGVGLTVALLAGRGEDADWRVFSSSAGRNVMTVLGAGGGALIGNRLKSPRWVVAWSKIGRRRDANAASFALAVRRHF